MKSEQILALISSNRTISHIRNIAIAAHIDHGKTTFSDNLLSYSGLLSSHLAGKQLLLDSDEQEKARGITINAAVASVIYNHPITNEEYLINIVDTPGHLDFSSEVVRGLRVVDGAFILVCAKEGIKPQTETVLSQTLRERVKPILMINKIDRLFQQFQLPLEAPVGEDSIKSRIVKIIKDFNLLILKNLSVLPPQEQRQWLVNPEAGTVIFGSAFNNWGFSFPYFKRTNTTIQDVFNLCQLPDANERLPKEFPLAVVAFDSVISTFPTPLRGQSIRLPSLWKGDLESVEGRALLSVDSTGPTVIFISKVVMDPFSGAICVGRIFSGSIRKGDTVRVYKKEGQTLVIEKEEKIQNIMLYQGVNKIIIPQANAGMVVGLSGFLKINGGDTLSSVPILPLEEMKFIEPVLTVSLKIAKPKELPNFITAMKELLRVDPSLKLEQSEGTNEYLLSAIGELQIENTMYKIHNQYKLEVEQGIPLVVYYEGIQRESTSFEGKSPNKHNVFHFRTKPLSQEVINFLESRNDLQGKYNRSRETEQELVTAGLSKEEARGILAIEKTCIFTDVSKGTQYLDTVIESLLIAFKRFVRRGYIANEPVYGVMIYLDFARIHSESEHKRLPQITPAFDQGVAKAFITSIPILYEPFQEVDLSFHNEFFSEVTGFLQSIKAEILDINTEEEWNRIKFSTSVSSLLGFSKIIKDLCRGRVSWGLFAGAYVPVQENQFENIALEVRKRKGLALKIPRLSDID